MGRSHGGSGEARLERGGAGVGNELSRSGTFLGRIVQAVVVLAPIVLLVLLGASWLADHVPERAFWRAGLAFLLGLEALYLVSVPVALVAVPVLAHRTIRGRRTGASAPWAARGLLACVSFLLALVVVELTCGAIEARRRRISSLPLGGLAGVEPNIWPPKPLEAVELPTTFSDTADDRQIDVAVVGESSAVGIPYERWVSIGEIIAWRLSQALSGRKVRVQTIANSGETLEIQHNSLIRLTRRPELFIIYCGHNEFTSRFSGEREVEHYLDDRTPGPWRLAALWAEGVSPFCGLVRETVEKCRIAVPPALDGRRALVDVPAYTPAESALLLSDFRRRLEAVSTYAESLGALVVWITPPANDAGFEPNRSYLPPNTPRVERQAFARAFRDARALEAVDRKRAIAAYRSMIERQPGFAESHYRLALLLEEEGDHEAAYRHFVIARDRDGYPSRCLTAFQNVYREVAARHHGILIDAQAYLHAVGHHGLLDEHLFHDAMHPSFRGQIALAQAVLLALRERHVFGWPAGSPPPVINPARCADRFGVDAGAWRYISLWGIMFYQLTAPWRYDPTHRIELRYAFANAATRIEKGAAPESLGMPNVGLPGPVPLVAVE